MAVNHSECTECGEPVVFAHDVEIGDILLCHECGAELEVKEIDEEEVVLEPVEEDEWG